MAEPEITGGAGGVTADYEDMATLARGSDDLAATLGEVSLQCHGIAGDPDVLASAVLSPVTAARFTVVLLEALDGPGGLTAQAADFGVRAAGLRAASASYEATDQAQAALLDAVRWSGGALAPVAVPAAVAGLLLADPAIPADLIRDPDDWQRIISDHPGIVDAVVGGSPGLLFVASGGRVVTDVQGGADLLADGLYPEGGFAVSDGTPDGEARMVKPPSGIGDVLDGLDARNGEVRAGEPDQIDVRTLERPDGTRAFIVDIPGTKNWNLPGDSTYLNDLGTNVHVLAGDVTAREKAIALALEKAGASSTDPVMLVGHSQGGMVAAQAAHDKGSADFGFNVTHVVTAGSPVGRVDVPDDVQVLSLENRHDITPRLDAVDNPDRPNWTTVSFAEQHGGFGPNHGMTESYLPAARALDSSTDPSIAAFQAGAAPFLTPEGGSVRVTATTFDLTRVP